MAQTPRRGDLTTVSSVLKPPTAPPPAVLEDDQDEVQVEHEDVVVGDDMVTARIRGTWEMLWGKETFDFEDGRRYRIPRDLFNYLRAHRNIYDHM